MSSERWAMCAGALGFAVLAGCTFSKKEKRTAAVDGDVAATVSKIDKKALGIDGIGHGPVGILYPAIEKSSLCLLRVTKPQKIDVVVNPPCSEGYRLSVDPSHRRLAYAAESEPWSIIYFGGANRSFSGLLHPPEEAIDWAKVPSLEGSYEDQLRAMIANEEKRDELIEEIVSAKGDSELSRVLVATLDAPVAADIGAHQRQGRAIWGRAFDRVKDKSALSSAFTTAMNELALAPEAATHRLARAALYGDVDGYDGKSLEKASFAGTTPLARYSIGVLLARFARREEKRALKVACTIIEQSAPRAGEELDYSRVDLMVALSVVGRAKAKCAAVDRVDEAWDRTEPESCLSEAWKEPSPSFVDGELAAIREMQVASEPAMVSAVLAQGPRPSRKKQLARQQYAFYVGETAPECDAAKKGECCRTELLNTEEYLKCTTESETTNGDWTIHFDDAKKRWWFTRAT